MKARLSRFLIPMLALLLCAGCTTQGAAPSAVPSATPTAAATPTPSRVEKDLSGFGDADDAFEFEEID